MEAYLINDDGDEFDDLLVVIASVSNRVEKYSGCSAVATMRKAIEASAKPTMYLVSDFLPMR